MSKGSKIVPYIDGRGTHLAIARVTSYGNTHKPIPIVHDNVEREPVAIKLPRRILYECTPGKVSAAFSHAEDLEGQPAVIWCTNDSRQITHAFFGIIEKISSHGLRRFALRVKERLDPSSLRLPQLADA